MSKEQILSLLAGRREDMRTKFGVKALGVFGSAARDEMRSDSDVDILVDFQGVATFDKYMDLKAYLETLLGTAVDLVTEEALKPRMRPLIEKDLVRVA
ncbi:MAG TPA: nucleotidyltransferase family protein [Nitrospira sp.]|nr:nucleotidyltransferase family protein [Nitrospira sp.]